MVVQLFLPCMKPLNITPISHLAGRGGMAWGFCAYFVLIKALYIWKFCWCWVVELTDYSHFQSWITEQKSGSCVCTYVQWQIRVASDGRCGVVFRADEKELLN